MKLKLTAKRGFTILEVSESISAADVALLRAGINKIFKTKREPLVLDFSGSSPKEESHSEISSLQFKAIELGADLLIVCSPGVSPKIAKIAQFGALRDAVQLLLSGASLMKVREQILNGLLESLETQRAALSALASELRERYVVKEQLPGENELMRRILAALESYRAVLAKELAGRKSHPADPRVPALEQQILDLLKGEKLNVSRLLGAG